METQTVDESQSMDNDDFDAAEVSQDEIDVFAMDDDEDTGKKGLAAGKKDDERDDDEELKEESAAGAGEDDGEGGEEFDADSIEGQVAVRARELREAARAAASATGEEDKSRGEGADAQAAFGGTPTADDDAAGRGKGREESESDTDRLPPAASDSASALPAITRFDRETVGKVMDLLGKDFFADKDIKVGDGEDDVINMSEFAENYGDLVKPMAVMAAKLAQAMTAGGKKPVEDVKTVKALESTVEELTKTVKALSYDLKVAEAHPDVKKVVAEDAFWDWVRTNDDYAFLATSEDPKDGTRLLDLYKKQQAGTEDDDGKPGVKKKADAAASAKANEKAKKDKKKSDALLKANGRRSGGNGKGGIAADDDDEAAAMAEFMKDDID